MIYLGVDYGKARIGLAKSDGLGMFAHGIGYVPNNEKSFEVISQHCIENDITEIVVGMPITLSGEKSLAAEHVGVFIEELKKKVGLPVREYDERMTTQVALRHMQEGNVKKKKRKQKVDQLAAQILLQNFLDQEKCRRELGT